MNARSVHVAGRALGRAARWRLLGLLFERPHPGWHAELRELALEAGDPSWVDLVRLAEPADEGLYLAALGPGAVASPREVTYRPMAAPGQILSDLTARYRAFGYMPRAEDPPDHVVVETGFVAYLSLKEAWALARDEREQARIARSARREFLEDHLADLAWGLAGRLAEPPHLHEAARRLAERCPPRTPPSALRVVESAAFDCA